MNMPNDFHVRTETPPLVMIPRTGPGTALRTKTPGEGSGKAAPRGGRPVRARLCQKSNCALTFAYRAGWIAVGVSHDPLATKLLL
jgi:hypothetical protein